MGAHKHSQYRAVAAAGVTLVIVLILAGFQALDPIEKMTLDWRFEARGKQPIKAPIVIIEIDQDSLNTFTEPLIFWGPHHARVFETLHQLGAKVIGFDAVQDISLEGYATPNPDHIWAQALATTPGVVLTCKRRAPKDILPTEQLRTALMLGGGQLAFDNTQPDADQVLRSQPLADKDKTNSFALAVAATSLGERPELGESFVRLGSSKIATDADWRIPINYTGPNGTFPRISYKQLLADPQRYRKQLEGAIALIGFTSLDLQDYHTVPFSRGEARGGLMAGVEVHANTIHTLLTGKMLRRLQPGTDCILIALLFLVSTPLFLLRSQLVSSISFVILAVVWPVTAFALFTGTGTILPLVGGELAILLNFFGVTGVRYWEERRSRKEVINLFGRYVSPSVVEHLMHNPEAVELGGKRLPVTILFSDIRGFTAISERMTPEQVTTVLNQYLTEMVEIIFEHGGTVDKYIGDAIMAIFNWPVEQPDHADQALRTALAMHQKVLEMRKSWEQYGLGNFDIGIGINTGNAVLGNIGSPRRMEQTAIGDTVNVASRLEGLNKKFGTNILISQSTCESVKGAFVMTPLEEAQVKGRAEAVKVFEVTGEN